MLDDGVPVSLLVAVTLDEGVVVWLPEMVALLELETVALRDEEIEAVPLAVAVPLCVPVVELAVRLAVAVSVADAVREREPDAVRDEDAPSVTVDVADSVCDALADSVCDALDELDDVGSDVTSGEHAGDAAGRSHTGSTCSGDKSAWPHSLRPKQSRAPSRLTPHTVDAAAPDASAMSVFASGSRENSPGKSRLKGHQPEHTALPLARRKHV